MDPNKELNRRVLKPVLVMAALEAFRHDARIVVLKEEQLSRLFDLQFFRDERFGWIESDAKPYFPHTTIVWRGKGQSYLLLSRDQLSTNYMSWTLVDTEKTPLGPPFIKHGGAEWQSIQSGNLLWLDLDQQGANMKRLLQDFFTALLGYD